MNQEDRYGEYEPEIDLKDMLFNILYKWRGILLGAVVFCMLLSGFGVFRWMSADPSAEPKKIKEYQMELARYQLSIAGYELDMADYQERLAQQEAYMEESVLMRTDPYAKPTASVDIFVKLDEAEWETLPDNINVDPTDSLIKMYTSNFAENLDWDSIKELTGGKELYLRELISVIPDYNSNTFTISVVHSDAGMSQQLLDVIVAEVMDKCQSMSDEVNHHTLSAVNQSVSYSIDASLASRQKSEKETIANYKRAILDCQEALAKLENEEPTQPFVIGFIKYPVVGFLLGFFLVIVFYCMTYLLNGKLHGEGELKDRYGYLLLGIYPRLEKRGFLSGIDRFLDRMSGAGKIVDRNEVTRRIAVNIINLANGRNSNILVTGTAKIEKLKKVISEIAPLLKGITLTVAADMNQDTKTLELLAECDGIILVEEKDIASVNYIQREHENIKALGRPVIGYILL